jgi:type I restriction enzyme, S subunit
MQSDWEMLTLAEAGVRLVDCDHRTPPAAEAGYPYVAIPQLKDGHVALSGVRLISRAHFEEWTKKLKPQEHDVIVVRRCNSGDSAVIPKGVEWAIGQNLVILRADGKRVRPEFLRWLVRGEDWWEQVRKYLNVGAVFDSLKCRDIPNFRVAVPSLEEQSHICEVLDAVDRRIRLLRNTNRTLEAVTDALFASWFVDFDPVRAKADARDPDAMDAATAALFPSEFEESSFGPIPKGWSVGRFGDLAALAKVNRPGFRGGRLV